MAQKRPTAAQIAAALDTLGMQANPVQDAWIKSDGTLVLLLVPNPEPVEYKPPTKTRRSKSGEPEA